MQREPDPKTEGASAAAAPPFDRQYYQHTGGSSIAERMSYRARLRVYRLFLELMQPKADSRILDLGVTDEHAQPSANLLERLYPQRDRIVCVGITAGSAIEAAYPGVRYVRITPGRPLPFADREFDIVYSNAVLEHVGARGAQAAFVAEACRVGKKIFIVVPNRLFPVEVHTGIPFLHYLPKLWFRALLWRTRYRFWASEQNLNYMSVSALRRMYPRPRVCRIRFAGIGFGPFRSNIVSYSEGEPTEG